MAKRFLISFLYLYLLIINSAALGVAVRDGDDAVIFCGPFIDYSDGKTLIDASLDVNSSDITCQLYKSFDATLVTVSADVNWVTDGYAELTVPDLIIDGPGNYRICFANAAPGGISTETILPFSEYFTVYPENVYDSFYSTDKLQVDMREVAGQSYSSSTTLAADLAANASTMIVVDDTDFDAGDMIIINGIQTHQAVLRKLVGADTWSFQPSTTISHSSGQTVTLYNDKAVGVVDAATANVTKVDGNDLRMTTTITGLPLPGQITVADGTGFAPGRTVLLGSDNYMATITGGSGNDWHIEPKSITNDLVVGVSSVTLLQDVTNAGILKRMLPSIDFYGSMMLKFQSQIDDQNILAPLTQTSFDIALAGNTVEVGEYIVIYEDGNKDDYLVRRITNISGSTVTVDRADYPFELEDNQPIAILDTTILENIIIAGLSDQAKTDIASQVAATDVNLAPTGLDNITNSEPSYPATNIAEALRLLYRWRFNKKTSTFSETKLYGDDETTVLSTHPVSDDSVTITVGEAD